MIKKFYLVGLLVLMGFQPISANHGGHFAKKVSVAQTQASGDSCVNSLLVEVEPGGAISNDPLKAGYKGLVKPSEMPKASMTNSKDALFTKYDLSVNGELLFSDSRSYYDEKNRLVGVDYAFGNYERYVYTEDSQGRTIQRDKYEHRKDAEAGTEILVGSQVYSYDHMADGESNAKAYVAKNTQLVENWEHPQGIKVTYEYVWFEPSQSFISIVSTEELNTEVLVDGHSFMCSIWNVKANVKVQELIVNIDDNSVVTKTYDESTGELKSCTGSKSTIEKADGCTTTTHYTYSGDAWIKSKKEVETDNWGQPWLYDGQHRERTECSYNATNGQFEPDRKRTYDWVHKNPNILMERNYYYTDGTTEVESSYEVVDDKGNWLSYIDGYEFTPYVFKDGGYVLDLDDAKQHGSSEDDTFTDIYVFYDKEGKEQARYRLNFVENTSRRITPLEIYKDGKWQNFEVLGDSYTLQLGDMYNYGTIVFNKEGYAVKFEEYEDNALYATILYTYTDNSCKEEIYKYNDGQKYLDEWTEYSVASDGTATTITRYHVGDIDEYGEKKVMTSEGVCYYYRWDDDTKDFNSEPSYVRVSTVTSVVNGVNTTISRSWEDGRIVETQKNEQKQEENGDSWSVTYNKVDNEWKPETKSVQEKAVAKPEFEVVMPKSEITGINSSSPITDVDASYFSVGSNVQNRFNYNWDDTDNDWSVTDGQEYSFNVEGNTLNYATTTYSANGSQSKQVSYTRDADNRLVEYTLETENTDNGQNINEAKAANATMNANVMPQSANTQSSSVTKKFEYDEKDRLSSVTIITDHEEKYVLHYADEPTGIELVKTPVSVQHVSIYGKTINVDGCKSLSLYSADGKLVAKSQSGSIEAPDSGLYIVATDGVKTKVIIK